MKAETSRRACLALPAASVELRTQHSATRQEVGAI